MNTNWSTPKTNIIAGLLDLRQALQAGQNAVLVKARNEDCQHPIKEKGKDEDFRNYKFQIGYQATRDSILNDHGMDSFHKYLALNYKACYGTPEAVKQYYETGKLSADNFKGMGVSHLVKVTDLVDYHNSTGDNGDKQYALMFSRQYLTLEEAQVTHFYDFYKYMHGSQWSVKKFKRKLWIVDLRDANQSKAKIPVMVKLLNVLLYPMKYIPQRSVLRMPDYKVVTYRIGGITNGYSIQIQIPKKFGFGNL